MEYIIGGVLGAVVLCLMLVPVIYIGNVPKRAEHQICIGGYQYELVVNEFNEPVWCVDNLPKDEPMSD